MTITDLAFTAVTVAVMPFYATMILAPKWRMTKLVISSPASYVLLGGVYLWVVGSVGGLEKILSNVSRKLAIVPIEHIAELMTKREEVAIVWIHFILADLFAARHVYLDGIKHGIFMAHSLVLCMMACPLGLLSHYITKALSTLVYRAKQAPQPGPV